MLLQSNLNESGGIKMNDQIVWLWILGGGFLGVIFMGFLPSKK